MRYVSRTDHRRSSTIGRRALHNACLGYLAAADPDEGVALAAVQFEAGDNMTDVLSALAVLANLDRP
jgi:aminopeptidase N